MSYLPKQTIGRAASLEIGLCKPTSNISSLDIRTRERRSSPNHLDLDLDFIRVMSPTLEHVRQLLATADKASKKLLLRDLHEIIVSVETPEETAIRM